MTISALIEQIKQRLTAADYIPCETQAITHLLFQHYVGLSTAELYLQFNDVLDSSVVDKIQTAVARLEQHQPLQYILGETEFYGLPFYVDENVLIPRPETEELVQWVINDSKDSTVKTILDMGTGSGCIAIALAANLPHAKVYAIDISEGALQVARQNAVLNKVDIQFTQWDMLSAESFGAQKFDCIVSNPPYIRNNEKPLMNTNVLDYEPHTALFVENNNPLIFYDAIARTAKNLLAPSGTFYVEINEALPTETQALFQQYGFTTALKLDMNNKPRMIKSW